MKLFYPPADVFVTPDHVSVVMDVPGFKADELDIELIDDVLTVRGQRAFPHGRQSADGREWRRIERGFGTFERSLRVPAGLDPDAVNASLADGVLTLLLPMPESKKPHRIQVMSGQPVLEQEAADASGEDRELAGAAA